MNGLHDPNLRLFEAELAAQQEKTPEELEIKIHEDSKAEKVTATL